MLRVEKTDDGHQLTTQPDFVSPMTRRERFKFAGLFNSFWMVRLPDPRPSSAAEAMALG